MEKYTVNKVDKKRNIKKVLDVIKAILAISFILSLPVCYKYCDSSSLYKNNDKDNEMIYELK